MQPALVSSSSKNPGRQRQPEAHIRSHVSVEDAIFRHSGVSFSQVSPIDGVAKGRDAVVSPAVEKPTSQRVKTAHNRRTLIDVRTRVVQHLNHFSNNILSSGIDSWCWCCRWLASSSSTQRVRVYSKVPKRGDREEILDFPNGDDVPQLVRGQDWELFTTVKSHTELTGTPLYCSDLWTPLPVALLCQSSVRWIELCPGIEMESYQFIFRRTNPGFVCVGFRLCRDTLWVFGIFGTGIHTVLFSTETTNDESLPSVVIIKTNIYSY